MIGRMRRMAIGVVIRPVMRYVRAAAVGTDAERYVDANMDGAVDACLDHEAHESRRRVGGRARVGCEWSLVTIFSDRSVGPVLSFTSVVPSRQSCVQGLIAVTDVPWLPYLGRRYHGGGLSTGYYAADGLLERATLDWLTDSDAGARRAAHFDGTEFSGTALVTIGEWSLYRADGAGLIVGRRPRTLTESAELSTLARAHDSDPSIVTGRRFLIQHGDPHLALPPDAETILALTEAVDRRIAAPSPLTDGCVGTTPRLDHIRRRLAEALTSEEPTAVLTRRLRFSELDPTGGFETDAKYAEARDFILGLAVITERYDH